MKFASEKKHESLSKIARNDWHGEHSTYFDGWKAYDQNPFHPTQNLDGVIQMGLAENQLSSPSRRNLTGEREMEVDWSSLHVLANASELVSEGLLSLSPAAQTRPNELPRIFWDKMLEMRGRDAKLVLEKSLRATDMDPNQGRLSIPKRQIRADFLSSEESQTLDNREAITVSLIEPCLEVRHGLQLKKWNYQGGAFSYVLTKQWNAVVRRSERNGLKENSRVQLWSFRVDGDLCFCLVNLEPPSAAAAEHMATHG